MRIGALSYLDRAEGVERAVAIAGYVDGRAWGEAGAARVEGGSALAPGCCAKQQRGHGLKLGMYTQLAWLYGVRSSTTSQGRRTGTDLHGRTGTGSVGTPGGGGVESGVTASVGG